MRGCQLHKRVTRPAWDDSFFRVSALASPVFYSYVAWPDGSGEGRLRLQHIAIGGIAALSDGTVPDSLKCGDSIKTFALRWANRVVSWLMYG